MSEKRTFEIIRSESSKEQLEELKEKIKEEAKEYYSNEMEYHNFNHALEVLKYADEMIERCKKAGISVNERAVILGVLCHDASNHEDHSGEDEAFEIKENYSAHIAGIVGRKLGMDEKTIEISQAGIRGTNPFIKAKEVDALTIEGKIMRAADVFGMTKPFDEFMIDNANLKMEDERMNKKKLTWEEWKNKSSKVIKKYLEGKIELTGESHENGKSKFHEKVTENLNKFMSASDEKLDAYLREFSDDYIDKAA